MSQSTRTIKAGCHCGNVRFDITLPKDNFPLPAHFCHCESCRRITGQLCLTTLSLPAEWQPEPALLDRLQPFIFTENVTHLFCPTCGATLMAACKTDAQCLGAQGGEVDYIVNLGVLDEGDTSVFEIKQHIFLGDTIDGGLSDFLVEVAGKKISRFEKYTDGKELPLYWSSPSRQQAKQPEKDERLHAHCKCGGVEFWLAQPSRRSVWPREAYEGAKLPDGNPEETRLTLKANWTKFPAAVCPCDSCRLAANGMAFAAWTYIPTVDISLDARGEIPIPTNFKWGTLREYHCTERTAQYFCGTCSASVFWVTKARPWILDFGVGMFDSPDGARCESWFHWRTGQMNHREDGLKRAPEVTVALEDGLQQYELNVQSALPVGMKCV